MGLFLNSSLLKASVYTTICAIFIRVWPTCTTPTWVDIGLLFRVFFLSVAMLFALYNSQLPLLQAGVGWSHSVFLIRHHTEKWDKLNKHVDKKYYQLMLVEIKIIFMLLYL